MSNDKTYNLLYRVFFDETLKNAYSLDPEGVMKSEGFTDMQQIEFLKNLILLATPRPGQSQNIRIFQEEEMKSHYTVIGNLREGINKTIKQMIEGYSKTMTMYTISFYMGIALIIASIVYAFFIPGAQDRSLLAIIFAGLGTVDIIGYFISNPPLKLQESRSDLAQLQASYFAWYQDIRFWLEYLAAEYWNRYLKGIQTANPEFASKASNDYREVQERVSSMIINNTRKILGIIEEFVESPKSPQNALVKEAPLKTEISTNGD